jgi:uncharacterized protein RhaS with RHS repeats
LSPSYPYDALNWDVSRTIKSAPTYFVYDGWYLIAEYDASGALQQKYIHGARVDEVLAKIDAAGTAVYYHYDGLGSTAALSSAAGALLESYHYDAFGKPNSLQRRRFCDRRNSLRQSISLHRQRVYRRDQTIRLYDHRKSILLSGVGPLLANRSGPFGERHQSLQIRKQRCS